MIKGLSRRENEREAKCVKGGCSLYTDISLLHSYLDSTTLSRSLANQGIKLSIRKERRIRKLGDNLYNDVDDQQQQQQQQQPKTSQ